MHLGSKQIHKSIKPLTISNHYSFKRRTEMEKQIKLLCSSKKPWLNGPTTMTQPITATSQSKPPWLNGPTSMTQAITAMLQSYHSIDDRSLSRFAKPKTEKELQYAKENAEPTTTKNSKKWALSIWNEWSKNRIANYGEGPGVLPNLLPNKEALDQWMSKFILEIRRLDGAEYPPNTIYQITCGIMRNIRKFCPEINFLKMPSFIVLEQY